MLVISALMRKRQENEVILSYKVSGQYLLNYLLIHAKKWKHYIPFSDVSERMLKILKLQFYQPIILSNAPDTVPWSFLFDFYSGGGILFVWLGLLFCWERPWLAWSSLYRPGWHQLLEIHLLLSGITGITSYFLSFKLSLLAVLAITFPFYWLQFHRVKTSNQEHLWHLYSAIHSIHKPLSSLFN